jgi:hypothetical protein
LLLLLLLWSIFLWVFTHSLLKMVTLLFFSFFVTCSDHRFLSNSTPYLFHLLIVGHTAYHVALCMFLHQYCAGWRNVVCCLPVLLTSAFAVCFCFEYFYCMVIVCNMWFYSCSLSF